MWRPFTGSLPHTPTRSTPPTETGGAEEVGNTGTGVNKRLKACLSAQPGQVTSLSEKSWFQRMQHPPGLQGRREVKWHLGEPETTPLDSLLPLEDGVWPGSVRTGGIPGGTSSKKKRNPPANAGDIRVTGLIPRLGRSPGHGNPLQYSCLEMPMDRGAWQATVYGVTKSRTRLK